MATETPGSPSPEPPQRYSSFVRELALAMELPFIAIAAVLIGGGLGYLLDRKLGTSPAFTLLLGLVGFAAGIWEIIRRVKGGSSSAK